MENLVQKFLDSPYALEMGAGKLSRRWNCTKEEIYAAKLEARRIINESKPPTSSPEFRVEEFQPLEPKYVGGESDGSSTIKRFESNKPLSPKEVEEMVGVDGITTYVARVWDKLTPSGKWLYSVDVRYRIADFYSKDEFEEKLKELLPEISPSGHVIQSANPQEKALVICLADDHVGAINVTNLFGNPEFSYKERLDKVLQEIVSLQQTFEEVHIVSLGDQMNGWSSKTTRGGHEVLSKSNKEQFDEYVTARVNFYEKLFSSGIAESYYVHDVENSNHSGLGLSYMANKTISMWLEGKFPHVIQESITDAIGGFQYGQHVIFFGHGKDEKFQKRPMPAVLNAQTDLYLYDYVQNKGYSPYQDFITFYKGDLHQLGIQMGKFGRYVNVQSIAGNSDYGDINFGNTKGGALLEILHKDSYRISSQSIWF